MEPNPPIINRPDALSELRKGTEWSLTVFGWAVWIVLFRPILMTGLWVFGIKQAYVHMVKLGGAAALVAWMRWYIYVILVVGLGLWGWNRYTSFRFRHREKRRRVAEAADHELALALELSPQALALLRESRELTIQFSGRGVLAFRPGGPGVHPMLPPITGRYDPAEPPVPEGWEPEASSE